jgi:hypothetical protein
MFTEPTVLILGAGASWHYGYPTGEEMLEWFERFDGRFWESKGRHNSVSSKTKFLDCKTPSPENRYGNFLTIN